MQIDLPTEIFSEERPFVNTLSQRVVARVRHVNSSLRGITLLINDFQGYENFEVSVLLLPKLSMTEKTALIEREAIHIRDYWCNPGSAEDQSYIFTAVESPQDRQLILDLLAFFRNSQKKIPFRLWSLVAFAMCKCKEQLSNLSLLPWIIENGVDDYVPWKLTELINSNGEASEYLDDVWNET